MYIDLAPRLGSGVPADVVKFCSFSMGILKGGDIMFTLKKVIVSCFLSRSQTKGQQGASGDVVIKVEMSDLVPRVLSVISREHGRQRTWKAELFYKGLSRKIWQTYTQRRHAECFREDCRSYSKRGQDMLSTEIAHFSHLLCSFIKPC